MIEKILAAIERRLQRVEAFIEKQIGVEITTGATAPSNAEYVVMSANGTLSDERILTGGANISVSDGGAGAAATVNVSPQGAGSGLDADRLESQEGAYYLARGNHTGTQGPATISPQGAGSGLGADTLDGQEGAYYLARANHTGTQAAATISDFDTEVGNQADVAANTAARHDAATLAADADAILSLAGQEIGLDTQSANTVLAGPTSGGAADPDFRALVADDIPVLPGERIELAEIGTATYDDVQDMQNLMHSAGRISGGSITDAGGGDVDVAAGTGLIRATDSETAELSFFDWSGSAGITIPADSVRFVGVEYNGGSPQIVVKTSDDWDYNTDFPLGTVVRSGDIHILNNPQTVGDHAALMARRAYETAPIARDERTGGLILGETGTRNITVSAGALWDRLNRYAISTIDTSGADTFDRYYDDGAGGWIDEDGETQWPNSQYDDGSGTLATMTNNWYAVHHFYIEADGNVVMVYSQNQYVNLAQALAAPLPAKVPDAVTYHARLLGRLIFQKGDSSATEIQSAFAEVFNTASATDHGNLAGLGDDDHSQYLLATGSRAGASSQAQDFGSNGIKADAIAESTGSAGVTINDALFLQSGAPVDDDWTTFITTVTQSGTVAHTGTARYLQIGAVMHLLVDLSLTASGTSGNQIRIDVTNIPVALRPASGDIIGLFYYLDAGTAFYFGFAWMVTATAIVGIRDSAPDAIGVSPNIAAASGDVVRIRAFWGV